MEALNHLDHVPANPDHRETQVSNSQHTISGLTWEGDNSEHSRCQIYFFTIKGSHDNVPRG